MWWLNLTGCWIHGGASGHKCLSSHQILVYITFICFLLWNCLEKIYSVITFIWYPGNKSYDSISNYNVISIVDHSKMTYQWKRTAWYIELVIKSDIAGGGACK